jgi:hypothetical protein
VNFIEGHEEASHMIQQVILNKDFVSKILKEAEDQSKLAEDYMHSYCEDMYPEICKAVQHRRA